MLQSLGQGAPLARTRRRCSRGRGAAAATTGAQVLALIGVFWRLRQTRPKRRPEEADEAEYADGDDDDEDPGEIELRMAPPSQKRTPL